MPARLDLSLEPVDLVFDGVPRGLGGEPLEGTAPLLVGKHGRPREAPVERDLFLGRRVRATGDGCRAAGKSAERAGISGPPSRWVPQRGHWPPGATARNAAVLICSRSRVNAGSLTGPPRRAPASRRARREPRSGSAHVRDGRQRRRVPWSRLRHSGQRSSRTPRYVRRSNASTPPGEGRSPAARSRSRKQGRAERRRCRVGPAGAGGAQRPRGRQSACGGRWTPGPSFPAAPPVLWRGRPFGVVA